MTAFAKTPLIRIESDFNKKDKEIEKNLNLLCLFLNGKPLYFLFIQINSLFNGLLPKSNFTY